MIEGLIVFFIIINVIAFVHELGHFLPAIQSGVKVYEFGFGYPPRIFGVYKKDGKFKFVWGNQRLKSTYDAEELESIKGDIKEEKRYEDAFESDSTVFSFNLLPLGAFNNLNSGRDVGKSRKEDKTDFDNKSIWKRFVIIIGGVLFNIVFGMFLFYIILASTGYVYWQPLPYEHEFLLKQAEVYPMVIYVDPYSPASVAELHTGDIIIGGADEDFKSADDFLIFLEDNKDDLVDLRIKDITTKEERTVKIIPDSRREEGKGLIGAGISNAAKFDYSNSKITSGMVHSINFIHFNFTQIGKMFTKSIETKDPSLMTDNMVGPVGIAALIDKVIPSGFMKLLELTALLSLIIGCMNLLPIPAVDGGRLVFLFYELIFRRKVSVEFEHKVNAYGFSILIILGVLIIIKDVFQFYL